MAATPVLLEKGGQVDGDALYENSYEAEGSIKDLIEHFVPPYSTTDQT